MISHVTLAQMCVLAYPHAIGADDDSEWIEKLASKLPAKTGFDLAGVRTSDDSEWYFAQDDDYFVVVARGTDTSFDWFRNFGLAGIIDSIKNAIVTQRMPIFIPMVVGPFAHRVHAGYSKSVSRMLSRVQDWPTDKKIVLAGHSKGGAEMRVLASHLVEIGDNVHALVTFGEPPSLSPELVSVVDERIGTNVRYVNCRDIVPRVLGLSRLFRKISHGGEVRYFDRLGVMRDNPGSSWMEWDRLCACAAGGHGLISDHPIEYYVDLLKRHERMTRTVLT